MTLEQIEELAALHAVGALDGDEREGFEKLLVDGDDRARAALEQFQNVAALAGAVLVPAATPPDALKDKILQGIRGTQSGAAPAPSLPSGLLASIAAGFHFVPNDTSAGWRPMRVPGAFIKLLSFNRDAGYAVALGRLEAGTRYPPHQHTGAEEIFMLSGDLHIGDRVLRAGDFHHADTGTSHGENFSVEGCTLLAVVSSHDILAELGVS